MEAHLPIPFRSGNTIVRKYVERSEDTAFNVCDTTLVDWKDSKGRLHQGHVLHVKWIKTLVPAWSRDFVSIVCDIYREACDKDFVSVKETNNYIRKRFEEEFGFTLPAQNYYVTVGIYPNFFIKGRQREHGMYKTNYVHPDHIYTHLCYNIMARPGRTFFVDNVCYNNGMGGRDGKAFYAARKFCEQVTERIRNKPPYRETTPYQ